MFSVVLTTTLFTILSSTHVSGMTLEERIRDDSDLSQVRQNVHLLQSVLVPLLCRSLCIKSAMMNIKRIIFRCLCVDVKLFVN